MKGISDNLKIHKGMC